MDFTKLKHILAVATAGQFSRAAEEVCITQPALSRSIAAFEAEFGVRLFERGRSGAALTSSGRMVVERAREILAAVRDLETELGAHAIGEAGHVALGVGPFVASLILPPLGREILRTRPKLRLQTAIKARAALLEDLAENRLECVLAYPGQVDELLDFEARTVVSLPLAVVVRRDHPLTQRQNLVHADLAGWPAATQIRNSSEARDSGGFYCENHYVLREIVLTSDCYWDASPAFIREELADGRLVALDIADLPLRNVDIAMIRQRNRTPSPAAQAVEEAACRILKELASSSLMEVGAQAIV